MTLTRFDRLALAALYAVMVWLLLTGCTPRRPECDMRRIEDMRRAELEELAGYASLADEEMTDGYRRPAASLAMPWRGRE